VCICVANLEPPLTFSILPHVARVYVRWVFLRAIFHRGWWLVTSLYLVTEVGLTPLELIFLGTAQGMVVVIFEVPAGVVADTFSRKWSIVIAHAVMGLGMITTGLFTDFRALVITQMIWGLSWTFSSGADVAWLTDEMDQPEHTASALTFAARAQLAGAATGLILFGLFASMTQLSTAIVIAGLCMWITGALVIATFSEVRFSPAKAAPFSSTLMTLRRGIAAIKRDRIILVVLLVTVAINGANEIFERLYPKRLVELGLPEKPDPILWLALLGLVTLVLGAIALSVLQTHINNTKTPIRIYIFGCVVGTLGLMLFALAPSFVFAMLGVLMVHGIAWTIVGLIGTILVNSRVNSEIRATMQSFLAQAENLGEITLGLSLGLVAQHSGIAISMLGASALVAVSALLLLKLVKDPF